MHIEIPLTQGQFALVDDLDAHLVSGFKWAARWSKKTNSYYAEANTRINGKRTKVGMHRLILGLEHGNPLQGDHVSSGATLDNRRSNLRVATPVENARNRRMRSDNVSGFKGVYRVKSSGLFVAFIRIGSGLRKYLGRHSTAERAYSAYCKAAKEFHGDFATL